MEYAIIRNNYFYARERAPHAREVSRLSTRRINVRTILRVLCLALILTVLTLTLVRELSRSSDDYSFEVATLAEYTHTDRLTGYVFRDEVAPGSANNGPVDYKISEGQTVNAGTELALVYRDDTGTDKRERAVAIEAEIATLQATLDKQSDWKNAYLSDYPALMRTLGCGDYKTADALAAALGGALGGRECAREGTAEALTARIDELQAQLDEMVEHVNDPILVRAPMDGVFYHTADGYEQTFGTAAAEGLTPEGLAALLRSPAERTGSIGKLAASGKWFLAVPTSRTIADTYGAGSDYTLHFAGGSLIMTLEKITPAENGKDALLLFSADALPSFLSCSRAQDVYVERRTVTGLSIPACALVEDSAVFVIRDGMARLCPVTPVQAAHGCVLIPIGQHDGALREGDRVIVSARQLFDGKVME